jgi:hypothetical protein
MKMNTRKNCILLIITLLFLSFFVSVVSAEMLVSTSSNSINTQMSVEESNIEVYYIGTNSEYSASIQKVVQICKCDAITSYLSISNSGSYPSKYFISVDENFVNIPESTIVLSSGETKKIPIYYTASCEAIFDKNIEFKISNLNGKTEILKQKVSFQDCQNLELSLEKVENNTIKPCGSKSFSVKISNTGSFLETYAITINEDVNQYVTLSKNSLTLSPHTSEIINLKFEGDCSVYGDYDVAVNVRANKNNKVAIVTQPIKIVQEYNYNVVFNEEEFHVCKNELTTKYMQVENYDSFANEFIFDVKVPSYPTFIDFKFPLNNESEKSKSIILSSKSKTSIPIEIDTNNIKENIYEITIKAKSVKGDISLTKKINVVVEDCYDLSIKIPENKLYRCGKDFVTQGILIQNKGTKDTQVELVYYGPEFGYLSNTKPIIFANNEKNYVNLQFDTINNTEKNYLVSVEMYHNGNYVGMDTFNLIVDEAEYCYNIKETPTQIKVTPDETNFTLNLKNIGTRYGFYEVKLLNSENYLTLVTSNITNNLELEKKQTKQIMFEIDSEKLIDYAKENNNNSLIGINSNVTLLITHMDSQTQFVKEVNFEIVNYPWYKRAWEFIYFLPTCLLIFSILVLALLCLLIIFTYKFLTRKKSRGFLSHKKVLGFSLIILLLAGTAIFYIFEFPIPGMLPMDSKLQLNMYEDKFEQINVSNYFYDPDGDVMTFEIESDNEDDVRLELNETILKITPNENWSGNFSFIIIATDIEEQSTESEKIFVYVKEVKDYESGKDFFSAWCPFFNLTLLFLVLLVIWLINSVRIKKSNQEIRQEELKAKRLAKKEEKEKLKQKKQTSKNK